MLISKIDPNSFDVLFDGARDSIPEFNIRTDNVVGFAAQSLIAELEPINTETDFITGLSSLCESENKYYIFKDVDQLCVTISDQMVNIRDTIYNKIYPTVESLRSEIVEEKERIIEAEGISDFETSPSPLENEAYMQWISPLLVGMDNNILMETVHSMLGIKSDNFGYSALSRVQSRLEFNVDDVNISQDEYDELIDELNKEEDCQCEDPSTEDCDCASMFIKHLFNKNDALNMYRTFITSWESNRDRTQNILDLNNKLSKLIILTDRVQKRTFDISKSADEILTNNIVTFKKLYLCAMYNVLVHREKMYSDTVIFENNTINKTELVKLERKGLGIDYLRKHVKIFHSIPKIPISSTGISHTTIMNGSGTLNQKYEQWRTTQRKNTKAIVDGAMKKAFFRTMIQFVKSTPIEMIGKNNTHSDYVARQTRRIENMIGELDRVDNNVTDMIYDFVVSSRYEDTVLPKAVKLFKKELINMADNGNTITSEQANLALASAMAEMIVDFSIENFVSM